MVQFRPKGGDLNSDHGATIVLVLLHGFDLCGVQRCKKPSIRGADKYHEILTIPKAKILGLEVI